MQIVIQASVVTRVGAGQAYDLATDMTRFHEFFRGAGPVPAVLRVEWTSEARGPGARRRVHSADGSIIVEEVLEMTRPGRHAYRLVSGFKFPFSAMVRWAEGDWRFVAEGGGTRITWNYAFELSSPVAYPLAAPIVRIFFRRAMQDCLEAMRDALA